MSEVVKKSEFPSFEEFENLFVNNESMARIEAYLNRFNPIRVMKMEHMEIRHSAILAWLLNPRETHGFEDGFLKAFLSEALRGEAHSSGITALDINRADLRDAEIRTEWHQIDIFIQSPLNKWVFIIENKFHSKQYKGQLKNYAKKVRDIFSEQLDELKICGVFLSLHYEEPEEGSEFVALNYETIVEVLASLLDRRAYQVTDEIKIFVTHYLNTLKDATGMNAEQNKMESLARELYKEHKRVLDFVIEHGASTDFALAARTLIGGDPDEDKEVKIRKREFYFSFLSNNLLSFIPVDWYWAIVGEDEKQDHWEGCQDWWMGYPIICWLELRPSKKDSSKGQLWLYAEVGPLKKHEIRKHLIEIIDKRGKAFQLKTGFQSTAKEEGKRYSKFFKKNSIAVSDFYDSEVIGKAIKDLLLKFDEEFRQVAKALDGFHEFGSSK